MSGSQKKKTDMRVLKTNKAVKKALFTLLQKQSFDKITVNDICEEAIVSRGAFYQNFDDKYHLLKVCLDDLKLEFINNKSSNDENNFTINIIDFLFNNATLIKHILVDSNTEVMNMIVSIAEDDLLIFLAHKKGEEHITELDRAKVSFLAGGFASILIKQIRENFPINKDIMLDLLLNAQNAFFDL